ncbi:MAG TPA: ABC transporter substrate-binding protein, partial [Syntrophomonas sp.]|nr:ABC transporter substrate-binding protein [Syntrophomonas sp.]
VVFANEGGIDLRLISRNDGNIELMAGKDSGINSVQDLKGKSIGISSNTIMEYSLDQMLAAEGMKAEDINKVAIPQLPTRLEMLQG